MRRKSLIGQIVLVLLGVQALIFSAFTCFELPSATGTNLARFTNSSIRQVLPYLPQSLQSEVNAQFPVLLEEPGPVRFSPYVPMAPAAIFVGYVLGLPLGLIAAAIFFAIGLLGPYVGFMTLAAGGGLEYYRQPTFGYLVGMLLAAWFAGRVTLVANTSLRQIIAIFGSLTVLHVIGLLYLVGSSLGVLLFEGEAAYLQWQPWLSENIRNLTWYSLPYDALFSLLLVGVGFPFRWLNSVLTAPDIAMRPKPKWDERFEEPVETAV